MIEQRGQVTGLEGDEAWVRIGGQSGCPACDAGKGCGAGLFGKLLNRSDTRVLVSNAARAQTGDVVVLGLDERAYLALVMRLYGLPLLAGLGGAVLAVLLMAPYFPEAPLVVDLLAGGGGLISAGVTLLMMRRHVPDRFTRLSPTMLNTAVESDIECAGYDRHEI